MRPENEARLRKIRRISGILRAGCKGLLVLIVIGYLMALVAVLADRGGSVGYFDLWFRISDLTPSGRLLVVAMSTLTSAVWMWCIYQLHQLFGNYSRGEIFTREAVGHLRQLGVACVLWGVMKIGWVGVLCALSTRPMGPMQVGAEIIPIGLLVIVAAWFMDMAVDLQEENELTV
ncbi:MAG TPA: DUF2975 domain-containing protein [Acidobacteriaceae bacterium]|jgi:hypothetical protein|nr:DUF2975 domain-containing protein [Acidobacteriaceae bacterium]